MLPDWEGRLCKPHKLASIFLNLLVVGVILLFFLTTLVDLLLRHGVHNLSNALWLSMLDFIRCLESGSNFSNMCYCARVDSTQELSSKLFGSSKSTNTSVRSYSFVKPRLMLFINLKVFTTCALLTWANCWY